MLQAVSCRIQWTHLIAARQLAAGLHTLVPSPYQTLGVSQTASIQEIKTAFKKKAKELHPDTSSRHIDADGFFQLVAAYELLSDPQKRQAFDAQQQPDVPDFLKAAAARRSRSTHHGSPRPGSSGGSSSNPFTGAAQTASSTWRWGMAAWARTTAAAAAAEDAHTASQQHQQHQQPHDASSAGSTSSTQPSTFDPSSALARHRAELEAEAYSALLHAYCGPSLDHLQPGQLPDAFEAEVRRSPGASEDLLQLVSGRTLLGRVRRRRQPLLASDWPQAPALQEPDQAGLLSHGCHVPAVLPGHQGPAVQQGDATCSIVGEAVDVEAGSAQAQHTSACCLGGGYQKQQWAQHAASAGAAAAAAAESRSSWQAAPAEAQQAVSAAEFAAMFGCRPDGSNLSEEPHDSEAAEAAASAAHSAWDWQSQESSTCTTSRASASAAAPPGACTTTVHYSRQELYYQQQLGTAEISQQQVNASAGMPAASCQQQGQSCSHQQLPSQADHRTQQQQQQQQHFNQQPRHQRHHHHHRSHKQAGHPHLLTDAEDLRSITPETPDTTVLELLVGEELSAAAVRCDTLPGRPVKFFLAGLHAATLEGRLLLDPQDDLLATVMKVSSPGVLHMQLVRPAKPARLLAKMHWATLPPSQTWLYPPRSGAHDEGGWYVEWEGHRAQERQGWVHPGLMVLLAGVEALAVEERREVRRARREAVVGKVVGWWRGAVGLLRRGGAKGPGAAAA